MSGAYRLINAPPSLDDFMRLRAASGLTTYTEEAARRGVAGALFGVHVKFGDETIGMGRIVGDGGTVFHVVDIAVDKAHHRRGVGRMIMTALTEWLDANAPPSAYVNLIADVPADKLYEQFGFRHTAPREVGMAYTMGRRPG